MRFRAMELPFVSRPIAIDIGNGDWRRVVSAANADDQVASISRYTRISVEGIKFPLAVPEMLSLEVSYV